MSFLANEEGNTGLELLKVPKSSHNHTNSTATDYPLSASSREHPESTYSGNDPVPKAPPATLRTAVRAIFTSSRINVLLVFVPLGFISNFIWSPTVTFILNFLAIIPLAKLLGFATEDLAIRVGETLGGLLNATFGNAVELIISVIALTKGLVIVVQASMLGSILSNLVFVMGFCFFFGGLYYKEQAFNITAAQTSASLMAIATCSLLLPAAFYSSVSKANYPADQVQGDILAISHATAVILLIIYGGYLFFQLKTHRYLFNAAPTSESQANEAGPNEEPDMEEEPQMPLWVAIVLLVVITVLVAFCAEFLVGAINDIVDQWHLTQTFVGLILLPIVGNAAEHVTAVTVALKDKMDLAIGVAIGSSMQIALLVTPLMVIIGWGINVPMTLYFNVYETAVMFISVLIVNYLINDGKSNWLEGLMLLGVYLIIAISFFYYPDISTEPSK